MSSKLEVTLKRSVIGTKQGQRETVKSLGLKKINDAVVFEDTPVVRGMINKVSHLVSVKEV